ncbi:hypothetical protein [Streptomyces sp. NPDC057496]|uniref:hypothetical protein n=1 Tax=Streptomyces sp. NPDC057496 TaxID=3346149 RepID=UPI0036B2F87D
MPDTHPTQPPSGHGYARFLIPTGLAAPGTGPGDHNQDQNHDQDQGDEVGHR